MTGQDGEGPGTRGAAGRPDPWPLSPASLALLDRLGACAERLRAMDLDPALLAPAERRDP